MCRTESKAVYGMLVHGGHREFHSPTPKIYKSDIAGKVLYGNSLVLIPRYFTSPFSQTWT